MLGHTWRQAGARRQACVCPCEATSAQGHTRVDAETQTTHVRDLGHGHRHPRARTGKRNWRAARQPRPAWGSQDGHRQPGMPLSPPRQKTDLRVSPALRAHVSASRALQGPGSLSREDTVGDREPGWSRCTPSPAWVVQLRLCPPCLSFLLCLAGPVDSAAPGSLPQGPEPRSSGGRRGRGRRPPRPHPAPAPLPLPKRSPERGPDVSPQEGEVRREAAVSGPQSHSRGRLLSTRAKVR